MANYDPVPLTREYTEHGKTFKEVVFRKPKLSEFMELGDVQTYQPNGAGGMMVVEHTAVIGEYITKLCVEPGAECLEDIDPADQIRIKDAVKGFFTEARAASLLQTNSSSD